MIQPFSQADVLEIESRGMSVAEVERQLALFADPPPPIRLVRPARLGDGIVSLRPDRHEELLGRHADAAARGRLTKLVPASGAASRMFQSLSAALAEGDVTEASWTERARKGEATAKDVIRFREGLGRLALVHELRATLPDLDALLAAGSLAPVLRALLSPDALSYGTRPKGLIPFHRYGQETKTPFEEHLLEGALTARGGDGAVRVHVTVSGEALEDFRRLLESRRGPIETEHAARLHVTFSEQSPATDTIAADSSSRPFRTADGRLLFRPGGHGALISNLEALGGDVVFIKNIDNVCHGRLQATGHLWKRLLAGALLELEESSPKDRPLRVCGVVRNEGEPGGGPFWVRGADGSESLQIVESSQVDASSPEQLAIFGSGTHFNPVDLVCSLGGEGGKPHALGDFVDPSTVFISRKSKDGRELRALERPGLWNGAMAGWRTVFVEVPKETFTPVKTVFDLLRPEHQDA